MFWKAIASLLSCYGDHQNCGPGRDWFEFNMEVKIVVSHGLK